MKNSAYAFLLAIGLSFFIIPPAAHAELTFTRTPSGPLVTNPITLRVQGVFGADICNTGDYAVMPAFAGFNVTYNYDGSYSWILGDARYHQVGDIIDETFTFPNLPPGNRSIGIECLNAINAYHVALDSFTVTDLTISPSPSAFQDAVVNEHYELQLGASGGTAPYSWSITSGTLPNGLSLDPSTGLISGTPTVTGSFPITVQLQDSTGVTVTKEFPLQVFPPIAITTTSLSAALVGENYSETLTGVGGETPYSWSIISWSLPDGLGLNSSTGQISGTPTTPGTYDVTVQMNDSNAHSNSKAFSIIVTRSNQPPVITPIGDQMVREGQTLSFTVSATDPDGDALTYSASNLPSGATFNPATHTFTWTPSIGQAGNYTNVEFTVMDNGSPMELDVALVTITVGTVNRPPVFTSVPPQSILEGSHLSFTVAASDPDGNAVALSASGTPTGATFNPATGVFSWTPSTSQAGNYTVTFVATDNGVPMERSTLDVVITVGDNPTPTEEADALVAAVIDANLGTNIENSYLANLQKVKVFIEQGKIGVALNQLDAFIQKVNQDYQHGTITQAQKDQFLALANDLKADLQ